MPIARRPVVSRARPALGLALALVVPVTSAGWAQTEPPADVEITGEARDDQFGWAVAAAGDVNGDGFVDYIAGAYADDNIADGSGQAYLFYGPLPPEISARNADATVTGEAIVDGLGTAVSGAGDVNSDGFDDVLIGARSNDTNGIQAGRAYLFHGPLQGNHAALEADAIISGEEFDEMGWSLAAAGDVNGDGFGDILIGAHTADLVGRAFLFLGPVEGELFTEDAGATFTGVIFGGFLGDAVSAGDLNDDGVPDLILGTPRPPLNGEDPGFVYVFFGPVTGRFRASEADIILAGEQDNDEFGDAVGAGDVNGDGADDLTVGAPQLYRDDAPGKAYVFYGPLDGSIPAGDADAILVGEVSTPDEGDLFGEAVASAGDSNGDDVDDLLVGAPSNAFGGTRAGRVYLFHGPLIGTIEAASADRIISGSEFDLLGTSVASARDANSDRLADLLMGAPHFFDTGGFGYAALFYGLGTPPTGLDVVVTPVDPPIVIPPEGGRVRLLVEIVNRSDVAVDFELWTELERPDGRVRIGSPRSLTLEGGASLRLRGKQRIRAQAPPGTNTLRGLVGTFPTADDSDTFTFVKE